MAENNSVNSAHSCSMLGCIYHTEFKCTSGAKIGKPVTFSIRVHMRSQSEIDKRIQHSVSISVNARNNKGQPLPVRENGEYLDVYDDLSYTESLEDMSDAELQKQFEVYARVMNERKAKALATEQAKEKSASSASATAKK